MKRAKPAAKRPSMELTSRRKYLIYAIVVSTWLSGVIWIALHYFFAQHGEFGAEPNPFEFWFLALHGACAFAALWLAGWIWTTHIKIASVVAPECMIADALTKVVLSDSERIAAVLAAFDARACVHDDAAGWRVIERAA